MNPHLIKRLFPGASTSLLAANAKDYGQNHADGSSQSPIPQHPVQRQPVGSKAGEDGDSSSVPGRVGVRVTSYRRRLIDPDNLCPKYFIDACRYAGFLRDDSAAEIEFTVGQIKVATKEEEKTVIEMTFATAQDAIAVTRKEFGL